MGAAVQYHVGIEFCLVNLTGFCTGDSDPDGDFIFDQIGQVIVRAIPGRRFLI